MPYMVFYIVISFFAVSFFHAVLALFLFKFYQHTGKKYITKGDRVKFHVSFANESFIPFPYIKAIFSGESIIFSKQIQSKYFSLSPHSKKTYTFDLECNYRGEYDIGLNSIEVMDLLGLFNLKFRVDSVKNVVVYPKIIRLNKFYLSSNILSESNSSLDNRQQDMSTISNIREYAYGDTFKRIHWKLTAKTGQLMVKDFQNTTETSAVIFVDMESGKYHKELNTILEDKLVESIISVLHYCLTRWIPVQLIYYSNKIVNTNASNPHSFKELYNTFSKIEFNQSVNLPDLMDVALTQAYKYDNLLVFTSNLNYDLVEKIYKYTVSGYDSSLIHINPGLTDEKEIMDIYDYLADMKVNIYRINFEDDIVPVLEG